MSELPNHSGPSMTGGDPWRPAIGAVTAAGQGTRFAVWAPLAQSVAVQLDRPGSATDVRPLERDRSGVFVGAFADVDAGVRYCYRVDAAGCFPDPASRYQPDGVHGASMTVDPSAFRWTDQPWTGRLASDLVIYEIHVGTFTSSGTFAGVAERLEQLRDLGVTAIELMPVADFSGDRNWGYDGVALFAPARCYGAPDDLRRLVDHAHALGLAVLVDVVYNHTGPEGSYLSRYSPYYFTDRHRSPWGQGVDLDGPHSALVREFFIENALHWIHEYHLDGLRLDATHAIQDRGPRHFLAELTERVHVSAPHRQVHVMAEDHRNLAAMVARVNDFGWGLDAVWADDFHHQMRRLLAGDREGYYGDFSGTVSDLAATLRQGWFFTGQYSAHQRQPRGTDPSAIPARRFVVCLQNHDQVGNRALGERLHHQIDGAAYRAASAVLLTAPQTPLLFMGQEWAASSPFQYFTDHPEPLGRLVTEGRRREFGDFAAFTDPASRNRIPDPQAEATFDASHLNWPERDLEPHASMLRLYAALLAFRRELSAIDGRPFSAEAYDDDTLIMGWAPTTGVSHLVVARLRGAGTVDLGRSDLACRAIAPWVKVLTTEDRPFNAGPAAAVAISGTGIAPILAFAGPAAVIFRARPGDLHLEGLAGSTTVAGVQ